MGIDFDLIARSPFVVGVVGGLVANISISISIMFPAA
jgi:hypothetical protein